nr:ATP dependent RNA helicase DDX17 [Hymenolepis microstoma]
MECYDGPIARTLVTTRELAQQVESVIKPFCSNNNLRVVCLYGGASKLAQARELRYGPEIVMAISGSSLDFLESGYTSLRRTTYLVVDEANRMLDMGFEPFLRRNVSQINVGSEDLHGNHNIKQYAKVLGDLERHNRLVEILTNFGDHKNLVFVATRKKSEVLLRRLKARRFNTAVMHGNKQQREHEAILVDFRYGRITTLVATDIAARELDITDIRYIVNYDYSQQTEDHFHRIGRAGKHQLIKVLREANQNFPSKLEDLSRRVGDVVTTREISERRWGIYSRRRTTGEIIDQGLDIGTTSVIVPIHEGNIVTPGISLKKINHFRDRSQYIRVRRVILSLVEVIIFLDHSMVIERLEQIDPDRVQPVLRYIAVSLRFMGSFDRLQ